jgi:DNA-binding CsgD family transcriptional regulator
LGVQSSFFMGVDYLRAQGWTEVAKGRLRQARDIFISAADEGERVGDLIGGAASLHAAARIGYPNDVLTRLASLTRVVQGGLGRARVAHVEALVRMDGPALAQVSETFETMGATLLAAEAAADSAVAWNKVNDLRNHASAARRVAWLASRCVGADTPALVRVGTPTPLTRAEWETAQLAAAGWTNRQIAAELVVSVRTVENHLQHVYSKLGVNKRGDLAAALFETGPS